MGTPDFLVIGHLTRDIQPDGTTLLGGTAFYAAVTAARLGYRVALYTATDPGLDLAPLERAGGQVDVVREISPATTSFGNRYRDGRRRQTLFSRAETLTFQELPSLWRQIPLVLLGPVAQEVAPAGADRFPQAIVGACLQGWLRRWDEAGQVQYRPWGEAARWLPHFSAAFCSSEDILEDRSLAEQYARHCALFFLTAGARGATLFEQGRASHVPAFTAQEVDPTGAGDVFASAFLVRYGEGAPPAEAARFAAAAAALSVQGRGAAAIPLRSTVEALLREAGDAVPTA